MKARELRAKYLAFFEEHGHQQFPSGSLIPYDVTGKLDESLLFNGAGMVQFKPFFRGIAQPPHPRLTTSQKCLRTGDIECVGDATHLTFFEMLGNFSFGDYFKKDAIAMSWKFLTSTDWLGLDPKRLSFTVFAEDDEAESCWLHHLGESGIDGSQRVFRLGEETNYWPAGAFSFGPPGPCGPNSEMFYWVSNDVPPPTGSYTAEDFVRDEEAGKWLEIWNDVFIQFEWQGEQTENGYRKTGMPELPFRSVDTGMGLERTAAVLSGFASVYDTDLFEPIFSALSSGGAPRYGADAKCDEALRIVADHTRAATFCIADGVLPSNTGRGYVLRRLIRRAILRGRRVLGFKEAFLHHAVEGIVSAMGDHYTELQDRKSVILKTLANEEALFSRTLEQGSQLLSEALAELKGNELAGEVAYKLYDTYGFPLEVTRELCAERGITVDEAGYKKAMQIGQERSRGASEMDTVYGAVSDSEMLVLGGGTLEKTEFLGYSQLSCSAKVVGVQELGDNVFALVLDKTTFYAESGGQVSDQGDLLIEGGAVHVRAVSKSEGYWKHIVQTSIYPNAKSLLGLDVECAVWKKSRDKIIRNHTATHLLHAALRKYLGTHVTQAGSEVSEEQLRFDFTHGEAMKPREVCEVEDWVNQEVMKAQPMTIYEDVPLSDARQIGAMALFGEKYADRVRVVQVGAMGSGEPSVSRELCGGIHVANTGQIGLFRIVHEGSVASGVRRITAVTGEATIAYMRELYSWQEDVSNALKSPPSGVLFTIKKRDEALRDARNQIALLYATKDSDFDDCSVGNIILKRREVKGATSEQLNHIVAEDSLHREDVVAVVCSSDNGKATFVVKVGQAAQDAGADANQLVKKICEIAGGGGGGRPNFARSGNGDASKVNEVFAALPSLIGVQVGVL